MKEHQDRTTKVAGASTALVIGGILCFLADAPMFYAAGYICSGDYERFQFVESSDFLVVYRTYDAEWKARLFRPAARIESLFCDGVVLESPDTSWAAQQGSVNH